MWTCASSATTGSGNLKNDKFNPNPNYECSDDDASCGNNREEGLECPICWESFNLVENVPYVLWCGHTLCKHCVMGLPWAALKFSTLPIHLPFFISCPWCYSLSPRMVYKGIIRSPRKNYFILWMVESMNGERSRSYTSFHEDFHQMSQSHIRNLVEFTRMPPRSEVNHNPGLVSGYLNRERFHLSLRKCLAFVCHLTAKLPLVVVFLVVTLYVIPASAAVLVLYILITVLFAFPSFLVLYFAYPSLDWLIREIIT